MYKALIFRSLVFWFTCGLTCYRGAEPPNPQKCSWGCLGKGRPEVGCSGGCSGRIFSAKTRRTSTLPSTLPSTFPSTLPSTLLRTPPRAGTSPSTPRSTFGVRGFGTSVAGQATRKFWFPLPFSSQGNSLVFRVFSAEFLCFFLGF